MLKDGAMRMDRADPRVFYIPLYHPTEMEEEACAAGSGGPFRRELGKHTGQPHHATLTEWLHAVGPCPSTRKGRGQDINNIPFCQFYRCWQSGIQRAATVQRVSRRHGHLLSAAIHTDETLDRCHRGESVSPPLPPAAPSFETSSGGAKGYEMRGTMC
jgi:hypothetical protein